MRNIKENRDLKEVIILARAKFDLFDRRRFSSFINYSETAADALLSDIINIIEKYDKRYLFEGDLVIERVVDMFYEDYTPHTYKRKQDLYNAYKVFIDDGDWGYEFGAHLMKKSHHQSNEYIYENSFVNGYHGGDDFGDDHPEPGVPWWKAPPTLKYWYMPATQWGTSPYYEAYGKINDLIDLMSSEKYNEGHTKIVSLFNEWYEKLLNVFKI